MKNLQKIEKKNLRKMVQVGHQTFIYLVNIFHLLHYNLICNKDTYLSNPAHNIVYFFIFT